MDLIINPHVTVFKILHTYISPPAFCLTQVSTKLSSAKASSMRSYKFFLVAIILAREVNAQKSVLAVKPTLNASQAMTLNYVRLGEEVGIGFKHEKLLSWGDQYCCRV